MIAKFKPLLILLIIGGILILQACKKDLVIESKPEISLIEEAKAFFETQVMTGKTKEQNPTVSQNNIKLRNFLSKKANWDKAFIRKISLGEAVIVPVKYDKTVYIKVGSLKQAVALDYLSYLIIYKNVQGSLITEMVTSIPDDNFWNKRNAEGTSFSGKVIVETWQGKFLKGYAYDGKGTIRPIEIKLTDNQQNKTSEYTYVCETTNFYTCVTVSTDSGRNTSCGFDYSETTCFFEQRDPGGSTGGSSTDSPSRDGGPRPGDYPFQLKLCMGASSITDPSYYNPCNEEQPTPTIAYSIEIHKILMRNAAAKLGFCAAAIAELERGIVDTDYKTYFGLEFGTSVFHFDGLTNYQAIQQNWNLIYSGVQTQQSANNHYNLGFLTHAFQDFYSHSNYAELLIKYYGNDLHNVPFSEVLNDSTGEHAGLRNYLEAYLKTGTFDLITYLLGKWGADFQNINYYNTHNYINKDYADTYAGDYSARLAELETHKTLRNVAKCN